MKRFLRGEWRMCKSCGKRFRAYVARQAYCSSRCRQRGFYWTQRGRRKPPAVRKPAKPAARTRAPRRRRARR